MAGNAKDLTNSTFDDAVSTGVTLVDFWAPWCPPCKMQGPIVEKLADSYNGKALVAKVNVDEEGEAAGKYGVASIPTIVVLKDGKEVQRFVGLQQEPTLASALDSLL
ncbi:MAG: thioredoxin [Planctomycetaceae bacterium]|nr:thioredoxin [Planctomycetaceae bacterium]